MQALIVYESMFGNSHVVADRIADGLASHYDVSVVSVGDASIGGADLVVVGGPTHVHTLSSERSRRAAWETASRPEAEVALDPGAEGQGLRDWLSSLPDGGGTPALAFDTRVDGLAFFTGRASKVIAKRLTRHGFRVVGEPESFLVDKHNRLLPGEGERATAWAATFTPAYIH